MGFTLKGNPTHSLLDGADFLAEVDAPAHQVTRALEVSIRTHLENPRSAKPFDLEVNPYQMRWDNTPASTLETAAYLQARGTRILAFTDGSTCLLYTSPSPRDS